MNLFKRKPKNSPVITNEDGMLFARLLFDRSLDSIEQEAINKELQPLFSSFDSDVQKSKNAVQYFFKDYPVTFTEGIIPGQGVIILSAKNQCYHPTPLNCMHSNGIGKKHRYERVILRVNSL